MTAKLTFTLSNPTEKECEKYSTMDDHLERCRHCLIENGIRDVLVQRQEGQDPTVMKIMEVLEEA